MKEITEYYDSPILFKDRPFLRGIGANYLENPFFNRWQDYLLKDYSPPQEKKVALLLVCAWGKPYGQSYIHYFIQKTIKSIPQAFEVIHQIIVSNCGVVPREFENYYPFCAYDWHPDFEWAEIKQMYAQILARRLQEYIQRHEKCYEAYCCYLRRDSDSYAAIRHLEAEMEYKIPNLAKYEPNPTELAEVSLQGIYDDCDLVLITERNLETLRKGLKSILESIFS